MPRPRKIQPGGTRGTVFEHVARVRLEDARVLFGERRYAGAIYLAGYAIECLLKWAGTRRQEEDYLPAQFETHDWDRLLLQTGLQPAMSREPALQASFTELAESWGP